MSRTFEDKPAVREATPLLLGIVGPSGSGKTYSALRLAAGIQRVAGGDVFAIDTEAKRMLHYADAFRFRHLAFGAPFSPLDYLDAIRHCVKQGAKTIVIDSLSHEHEGPGGVLEEHATVTRELAVKWKTSEYATQMPAWGPPKEKRRQLINGVVQLPINLIACFRAKEKLKLEKGKDPVQRGWQPIGGEEFIYEMAANFMLHPGAKGRPSWKSEFPDEQAIMKLPSQFEALFTKPAQLSEDLGEAMARWAAGSEVKPSNGAQDNGSPGLLALYAACDHDGNLAALEQERQRIWGSQPPSSRKLLKAAADAAAARIAATQPATDQAPEPGSER